MCKTKKWWKSVSQWFWFNYIHKDYPEELGVQKVATPNQIQTCRTLLSINSTITPSQEILKIPTNPRVSLNASKSSVNRITWRSKSSPDYSPLHQTSRFKHWTSPNHKKTYTIFINARSWKNRLRSVEPKLIQGHATKLLVFQNARRDRYSFTICHRTSKIAALPIISGNSDRFTLEELPKSIGISTEIRDL